MAKSQSKNFPHNREKVFNAALQAITDLGYKIDNPDKANGLLNFKTGMSWKSWAGQEMSILVLDNQNNTCSVNISGRRTVHDTVLSFRSTIGVRRQASPTECF